MKMIPRSKYKWTLFKMTWLVPNYARAKGPAWWLFEAKEWWFWNMTTDFSNSFLSKALDKLDHLKGKLTFWLKKPRELMWFIVDRTETKLLSMKSCYAFIRTRGEDQYYFEVKVSLLGKLTVNEIQYIGSDGLSKNKFIHHFIGEEPLTMKQKEVYSCRVLTEKQKQRARAELMKITTLDWIFDWIAQDDFVEKWLPIVDKSLVGDSSSIGWILEDYVNETLNILEDSEKAAEDSARRVEVYTKSSDDECKKLMEKAVSIFKEELAQEKEKKADEV